MPVDREDLVAQQPLFYRNAFRRLLTFGFVLIFIIFALLGLIFYQEFSKPPIKYFVTTTDGRVIEIFPS